MFKTVKFVKNVNKRIQQKFFNNKFLSYCFTFDVYKNVRKQLFANQF